MNTEYRISKIKYPGGTGSRFPALLLLAGLLLVGGCTTLQPPDPTAGHDIPPTSLMTLAPGDELEISFLEAPDLNTIQRIRRDGRISLSILGDIEASEKTVGGLKEMLADLYAPHLQVREITVIVRSQTPVFVSGAVLAPGRIEMQRHMTALEAVMEAGGFDLEFAKLNGVVVIRHSEAGREEFLLDLGGVLEGKGGKPFYLKPNDIVHVPQRKPWL
ncbi:MAG: polysaccharide biosynthesis/export family protein [Kiritimatiellae bacterium]|nr:polysaccharide biosynthesis/export family protein [Kiritimatiellia bacterium]